LEEISTHNIFKHGSWFDALYLIIGDGGGAPLKI